MRYVMFVMLSAQLGLLLTMMVLWRGGEGRSARVEGQRCRFSLVESIPQGLTYPHDAPRHTTTFDAWMDLLEQANHSIDLGVFYWTLTSEDVKPNSSFPSADQGEAVLKKMLEVGQRPGLRMRIAQNAATPMQPQRDSAALQRAGAAEVHDVDMAGLFGGVLHTKLWTADRQALYLGSANMDFRSLTQVKELGVVVRGCSTLAQDAGKVLAQYRYLAQHGLPQRWPQRYRTDINRRRPASLLLNGHAATVFLSSSPPPVSPAGRTDDVTAIVAVIDDAAVSVDVAVMDYYPRSLYSKDVSFWPVFDNALRRAAVERGVRVRVLASHWSSTRPDLVRWLRSLAAISQHASLANSSLADEALGWGPRVHVEAKMFVVPAFTPEQKDIPFGRVNHNKYMVTDRVAYIGTSNWSEDYFTNTGGVGLVVNETLTQASESAQGSSLRTQLQAVFDRDWNSEYALPLDKF